MLAAPPPAAAPALWSPGGRDGPPARRRREPPRLPLRRPRRPPSRATAGAARRRSERPRMRGPGPRPAARRTTPRPPRPSCQPCPLPGRPRAGRRGSSTTGVPSPRVGGQCRPTPAPGTSHRSWPAARDLVVDVVGGGHRLAGGPLLAPAPDHLRADEVHQLAVGAGRGVDRAAGGESALHKT